MPQVQWNVCALYSGTELPCVGGSAELLAVTPFAGSLELGGGYMNAVGRAEADPNAYRVIGRYTDLY